MQNELAQALIDRGVINNNTRIIAKCPVIVMGGMPGEQELALTVDRAYFEDGALKFRASHRSGKKYSVPAEKITIIDGMDPVRLAQAFDIKADGTKKISGKKRGRKPKAK